MSLDLIFVKSENLRPVQQPIRNKSRTCSNFLLDVKYKLLTTHCARRSFATNMFKAGVPTISIMKVTGHRTEKAFLRYIKITPDEHAKILMKYFQKQNLRIA